MADKALNLASVEEIRDWAKESFSTSRGTITLNADAWTGEGPYQQPVTVQGATENSKIDLQPDADTLAQLSTDRVKALWVENDDGVLTAYALGAAPTAALSVQYTKTEVN